MILKKRKKTVEWLEELREGGREGDEDVKQKQGEKSFISLNTKQHTLEQVSDFKAFRVIFQKFLTHDCT
jgi:hypothetical protein